MSIQVRVPDPGADVFQELSTDLAASATRDSQVRDWTDRAGCQPRGAEE